ncbi:hypothetical protein E3N88_42950 [Mikania micrantha]|uniref:Uncharacterized protein n=1 Tax=Mikania micrantha TaxID=192012 RepID=A0A5N6LH51_9ASTR|nr:hypothetical protein E3N88_42950 [Mikania micrantha]
MALKNALIAFMAPLPSIIFYIYFLNHHQNHLLSPMWKWCYQHPLILANILFFLNINVGFWIISLLQSSNWMIDLYWTVIPVLLVHYFGSHPGAEYNYWRSRVVVVLVWVWAIRLTHNYFRREKWQWGAREDWRFTDMARQHGKNWWWVSFFGVYLIQQGTTHGFISEIQCFQMRNRCGTMAQEPGTAPAPSPSMESAGMMLQVPTLVAGIVSLVACFF